METKDWLRVIKRINTHGWKQGSVGGPHGPNCLLGAVEMSHSFSGLTYWHVISDMEAELGVPPSWFNDKEGRTKGDIINFLHVMAARAAA